MSATARDVPTAPPAATRRPPVQRRSIDAYRRALAAARSLMATRDFDMISIRELARTGGYSVGSFYYRFGTKDAFFDLLIEEMIAKRREEVGRTLAATAVAELPAILAKGALATHRANAGLLRSAIKKQLAGERKWEPISVMGREIAGSFIQAVEKERGHALGTRQQEQVYFSFVWLYGLLCQSVLGLNTIFGMETSFFEREAVIAFERAIARALQE